MLIKAAFIRSKYSENSKIKKFQFFFYNLKNCILFEYT